MFLTPRAAGEYADRHSAVNMLVGKGFVRNALERWVSGGLIIGSVASSTSKTFLSRLDPPPDDVWEIRLTEPTVQARIFCRFVSRDALIVTNMHTRDMLGGKGSHGWAAAMAACTHEWGQLLPGEPCLKGTTLAHFISENYDDKDAKRSRKN